jgi:hypothetical protein
MPEEQGPQRQPDRARLPQQREVTLAKYAFFNPIKPGKTAAWKGYVEEMKTTRQADMQASRSKIGLKEEVWLQHTPMGDFAVIYWEAPDIGKAFGHLMTSQEPFDKWFRDKILIEVHGMDPAAPPPPRNEAILG